MSGKLNPTTRTLRKLEADGWMADEVERRITRWLKHDLFGIGDVLAIKGREEILIQATSGGSGGHTSHRVAKIKAEPRARKYLFPGSNRRIQVWAWWKPKRTREWEPKITEIRLADLAPVEGGRES